MKASKEYLKALTFREFEALEKLSPKGLKPYLIALKTVGTLPLSLAIFLLLWELSVQKHINALHGIGIPLLSYVEAIFLTFMLSLFFTEPTRTTKLGFFASIAGSLVSVALIFYFPEINPFFLFLQGAFFGNFLITFLINKKDKYFRAQVRFLTSVTVKIVGRLKVGKLLKTMFSKRMYKAKTFGSPMRKFAVAMEDINYFILGILIFLPALFLIITMALQEPLSLLEGVVLFLFYAFVLAFPAFFLYHLFWQITFRLFLRIFRFFGGKK